MSVVKGRFIDESTPIKSSSDPLAGEDLARKSYVDSKAASEAASAVAGLDLSGKADLVDGKVPSSQLPSYVDDVVEADSLAALPATGETSKIYVTKDTNKTYRWTGSVYVEISASPGSSDAVPEGSSNLYFTAARAKQAAVSDAIVDGVLDVAPSQNSVFDALAGKQASLGTGTTAQYLRGDLTWSAIPKAAKVLTVGVDAATIAGCIALCTSPSATNNYVIEIPPGSYTEDLTIPGNVHLKGLANPNDSLSVKITGQHSIQGASNNALNNRVSIANILFVSSHATTPMFAIGGILSEVEVQFTGCFLQNVNTALTAKLFNLSLYAKLYINNSRLRMAGSSQGGTHFTIAAGAQLYTQYGLDVDGGTCAIDMPGQAYAQIQYGQLACSGTSAIKIGANGMVILSQSSLTNGATVGNGVNMTGAGASFFASHCAFNILDNGASYVVTGVAGSAYGYYACNYSHIAGVVTRNTKIGASVSQLRYTGSLTSLDINDFTSAAKAAVVQDSITDGVTDKAASQNAVFDALALKLNTALKGAANGLAELDGSGKVPALQLPSYVDDVIEAANLAALPVSGEAGKIYVTLDTGKCYRWSGSAYIEISPSPGSTDSLVEGSVNLYYTNARAAAAAPVQSVSGRTGAVTLSKSDVGLSNVDNTSDADKPVSTATATALSAKQNSLGLGTSSQYLRGDLQWAEVPTTVSIAQTRVVTKAGNDATGDGSLSKPYLTIAAAMASITDASPTKRYIIKVEAGAYTEGALTLKPNVFVVGDLKEGVRVTASSVAMDSTFSANSGSDHRSGMARIILTGACNFDWNAVTSAAGKLYFTEVSFASAVTMNGYNNAIAQAQFDSCQFFGALTISGINVGVFKDNVCYSNITLNQHPNGGMATILNATGGYCGGTLRFNTTVNDFNRRCSGFLRGMFIENLIIDGAVSYCDADLVSQGKSSTQKLNGGQLVAMTPKISHDLEMQMIKPITTNAHNMGDWGKQWSWMFGYVHASSGSDMYLISYGSSYGADSVGRSIGIYTDGAGLQTNVDGGEIVLETAATSGTGVRGKITLNARLIDCSAKQLKNVANATDLTDAVTLGQVQGSLATWEKATFTLAAQDITNGYIDLADLAKDKSTILKSGGVVHEEGATESYTVSTVGGVSRITFLNDLVTGSSALIAGDKVYVQYQK
jgi:hypothetical protein